MLSEKSRLDEIERRKSAGNISIPSDNENEKLLGFYDIGSSLIMYSQFGFYIVKTSDDIDPDVTRENVPWSVSRILNIGGIDALVFKPLGMIVEAYKFVIIDKITKQEFCSIFYSYLVSVAELSHGVNIFKNEIDLIKNNEGKLVKPSGTGVQIPSCKTFEISFGLTYSSAKRCIIKLISLMCWACEIPDNSGPRLDVFIRKVKAIKTLSKIHNQLDKLEAFVPHIEQINHIRNGYEHPSDARSISLENIELLPDGNLQAPKWMLMRKGEEDISADYYYAATNLVDLISDFAESVVLFSAAARSQSPFGWQVIEKDDVNVDFPYELSIVPIVDGAS